MAGSMIFAQEQAAPGILRMAVRHAYRADEARVAETLVDYAALEPALSQQISAHARRLIEGLRAHAHRHGGVEALLKEYDLSSEEGVVLMCLAEALLRVPDKDTADRLIHDKLTASHWRAHLSHSHSLFVNASTWGLMVTGRLIDTRDRDDRFTAVLGRLAARVGEPVVRAAVMRAMGVLGRTFVLGRTIDEALDHARAAQRRGHRHSFDMLGEAARSMADADRYFEAYRSAIEAVGARAGDGTDVVARPGISVKLSALHPRYELGQQQRVMTELLPRLQALCRLARDRHIGLCVDAEEAARLDLSLDLIEAICGDADLADWDGFGLAVQAYQKRAFALIDWLLDLARRQRRRLMIRLVKGAYWDTEIKAAQVQGLDDYPVFTRKVSTDVSWLACARKLLAARDAVYPQFATHNAHSVAAVLAMAGGDRDGFEFQRLHGMGDTLYQQLAEDGDDRVPCRIYAPTGHHEQLLAYLVRRLLENGANSSFVNRLQDDAVAIDTLVADPVAILRRHETVRHPRIPLPADLYGDRRRNSRGIDLSDRAALPQLAKRMEAALAEDRRAGPQTGEEEQAGPAVAVHDPADRDRVVGQVCWADAEAIERALAGTHAAEPAWQAVPVVERARILERVADLYEAHYAELLALCVREAGKSLADAIAEVREACDFCRFYAARARELMGQPLPLPGPTGESNTLSLHGRGLFVCISPWNFPLAIFTGQVSAALVAGNTVIAKPAEQTSLIAARARSLMREAGVPDDVLALLPGVGSEIGPALVRDRRVAGVAFTGSSETARSIHRALAARDGPIVPLIAETGGQNAMIVDSTALPEQVVADVVQSAFYSAGQRCSALRVLCLQEDVAERMIALLRGAMAELVVGDPGLLSTDIGPIIDAEQLRLLHRHIDWLHRHATLIGNTPLPPTANRGHFLAPVAFEIGSLGELDREVFGPVLHVLRYRADQLDALIDAINATGYGLTLGVHSRIDETANHIAARARVGNLYVNRNMVGAVVGSQPFGGEGLSGTGFKAGGPHYLLRFTTERVRTINTTAAGGNASLFSMDGGDNPG